jgi:hypothetical protein
VAARFCGRCGLFGLALLALGLAGCGRRGDLDPPPGVPASQVEPLQLKTINPMAGDPAQPGHKPIQESSSSTAMDGKTFILDPLVK